jgi:hypothetical protein
MPAQFYGWKIGFEFSCTQRDGHQRSAGFHVNCICRFSFHATHGSLIFFFGRKKKNCTELRDNRRDHSWLRMDRMHSRLALNRFRKVTPLIRDRPGSRRPVYGFGLRGNFDPGGRPWGRLPRSVVPLYYGFLGPFVRISQYSGSIKAKK